jgi:hypothetical protein
MKKRVPYGILFGLHRPAGHTDCQIIYTHLTYYVDAVYQQVYRMAEKVVDCCKGHPMHLLAYSIYIISQMCIYSLTLCMHCRPM